MTFFAPIVEGHGEVDAVPALIHRIASGYGAATVRVNTPIRVKAGSFLNDADYFSRYLTLASSKAAQEGGIVIILLDCEDECPARLGPELLARAKNIRADVKTVVILAAREFETWFLTAAPSLQGLRGLPADLQPPVDPMRIRDAKGWLADRMDVNYDPITHQLEFVRAFDLAQARANRSFDRMCRVVEMLIAH